MKTLFNLILCIILYVVNAQAQATAAIASFSEPSMSPDGSSVVFVSGGDIWSVSSQGGQAHLLVAHVSYDSRPLFSPDGKQLAFISTRTGNGDVYTLNLNSGELKRITFDDASDDLNGWSRDGKYLYFSSSSRDISGMSDVFRVRSAGGTPMAVTDEVYTSEYFASSSPDGSMVAFNARGISSRQWWRNGHSHLDESEIWLKHENKSAPYEQVTHRGAKEIWPMWSADGKTLYYMSDRSGTENLWSKPLNGTATQLTSFKEGRVLWPSISYDGKWILFERNFEIWKYDITAKQAVPLKVMMQGLASPSANERMRLTNQFNDLAVSPDGKKAAFIARGEVFAVSIKDGGDAFRITYSGAEESDISWSPESKSVAYVSDREGVAHVYQYNFTSKTETKLTSGNGSYAAPVFSPNGKMIAFVRQGKELRVFDVATKKETLLTNAFFGTGPVSSRNSITWSPDNQWIAFASHGTKIFRNISVVPAAGGEVKPLSFLSNTFGSSVNWSTDGKYILFNTRQRTEDGQIARIDLVPKAPLFRENRFEELFSEPSKGTSDARTSITFNDIRKRLIFLPLGLDAGEHVISHDGKTLLFVAAVGNQQNIYSYSLDESSREPAVAKQITSTANGKSFIQFSNDDKEVYYLEQGRIQRITLENRQGKAVDVIAELDVDFAKEKMTVFEQAWRIQKESFYDSTFHGSDWNAVRKQFEPIIAGTQTPDELRRVISLMLGELNASHSGISGPGGGPNFTTGRIGLRFDRAEYEQSGKLKISEVIAMSPTALEGSAKPGDYLVAVDDMLINSTTNLDQLLSNTIGKRVSLTLSTSGKERKIFVQPINQSNEKRLLYLQWVEQQREYVSKASNGRLGYVHIFDMGAESLEKFHYDLDTENHSREGVVVDVRNNNGGFVNAYALDVLTRKGYMTMTIRGLPSAPARTQLGQRSLEAPTILVTNQHSLSDAEDFTEGYRTLQLGKVVGEPTSGWIIYTSSARLIDGSVMRLPFIKITDNSGKNMELAPRQVDLAVTRPLGESAAKKDSQLDAAVSELLKQLKK